MRVKSGNVYANALAAYQESTLLSKEKILRISDADFSDALRMLHDYGYGGGILPEDNDINLVINRETELLIQFFMEECADKHLYRFVSNKYDYSNAKTLYKRSVSDFSEEAALYRTGNWQSIQKALETKDYSGLSADMAQAFEKLDAQFAQQPPSSKEIDIILTRAYYKDTLKATGLSRTLRKYLKTEIDLKNIMTALRCKSIRADEEMLSSMLVEGGYLDLDRIRSVFSAVEGNIPAILEKTPYESMISDILQKASYKLSDLETAANEYVFEMTKKQIYEMGGIDPFFRYYLKKLKEIRLVKVILICLKNHNKEEIARRLKVFDE